MRVVVVGAGVIGLTCAVRVAEAGHDAHVVARDLPLETTSAVAAALWYPYRARPYGRVVAWAKSAYEEFARLSHATPESGVRMIEGTELLRTPTDDPWWAPAVPDLRRLSSPPAGYRDGWSFLAPVIDMSRYLPWLTGRLVDLGGTVTRLALSALPTRADLVVNCSGLGSRRLVGDTAVQPVCGQIVRVEPCGVERWWLDASGPTYVVPRLRDVVVGGTDAEGEWRREPNPDVARHILARAAAMVPLLGEARVVGHRVGLRPGRTEVRLEREDRRSACPVVHCYGHGGAGVTLSWGCADEVVTLLRAGS